MRRVILLSFLILLSVPCFGATAADLSKQAAAFYVDNNYNRTMDLILQIDEKERTAQDWLLLGNLMEERGERENAVFMYQKSINTDKKFYKAYYNLANIYLEDGRYNMAADNYKKAISANRENPYLHYNLACAYMKLGKIKKAKASLLQAITLKPDVPEFQYNLAYVYNSLNKPKVAQSYLDNYNKLIARIGEMEKQK